MAKNVPTKIAGAAGAYGHTYLVKTTAAFNTRSGVTPQSATNPWALTYTTGIVADAQSITMAQERENHEMALKVFHTQEGVTIRLCKVVIASVPKELLIELEDKSTFFDKQEVLGS